jgi:hypothetical protein
MKLRSAFFVSLALVIAAVLLVLGARGQLEQGVRIWQSGNRDLFRDFSHRGAWLFYSAWALAVGGATSLFVSYRRREPGWRWAVLILLGLFLLFGLSPV